MIKGWDAYEDKKVARALGPSSVGAQAGSQDDQIYQMMITIQVIIIEMIMMTIDYCDDCHHQSN